MKGRSPRYGGGGGGGGGGWDENGEGSHAKVTFSELT